MEDLESEGKALTRKFSDKARKVTRSGKHFLIPHKFTPDGDVINDSNFNPRRDLSRLMLDDFRLLEALQEKKWNLEEAAHSLGLDLEHAQRRFKKLSYFEFEEKKSLALASVATPAFVASKNLEGFFEDNLSDGQRDHLKELAKITGAYKQPVQSAQINVFNIGLTPEQEAKLKPVYDAIASEGTAA